MKTIVITPPAIEPITYRQAKIQCNIDDDNSREWLTTNIRTVRANAERETGLSLITRTLSTTYFVDEAKPIIRLPYGPVQSIISITNKDGTIIGESGYELRRYGNVDCVAFTNSMTYPINVTYDAGYGNPLDVPPDIVNSMLCHLTYLWENRSSDAPEPKRLQDILDRYRVGGVIG